MCHQYGQPALLLIVALVALTVQANGAVAAHHLYVKPDGCDDRSGTSLDQAFATLARAQSAVRAMQPLDNDVDIHIAPGLYLLSGTFAFDTDDSAPAGQRITYRAADPNDRPRISGGRLIAGQWIKHGEDVCSTAVGEGDFRQLYVNGCPAICAREPDQGQWRSIKHWEPITGTIRLKGSGILDHWERMEHVEFVVKKHWGMSRLHIKRWGTYDGDDVFKPRTDLEYTKAHVPPKADEQRYFFENALELLDQPGEWYLDRQSRTLYYKPRPGEHLAEAEVIAPRLERLVEMKGTANVTFDHLIFEHANWLYPDGDHGYVGCQANVHWDGWQVNPGAVHLTDTQDVIIRNCAFRNTTAAGLCLVKGTQRTRVEGNVFTEIGDTPIAVYTAKNRRPEEPNQCREDVICNNFVCGFGRHNYAAAGICVAVATNITVAHNEVTDGGYAGITYGYFSEPNSPAAGSRIRSNYVHHVMQELDDGAGIYVFNTEFDQSHSTLLVERNFIHDVVRGPTAEANPVAGIYLDEGTRAVTLRENVIRNVGNTIHLNTGGRHGCRPDLQVYDRNTDADAQIEAQAGLEPAYRHLNPHLRKPARAFETPVCLHHWPLDGDARDVRGDRHGTVLGGAVFDTDHPAVGTAAVRLNGKGQYVAFPEVTLPDRFTLSLWLWLPARAYGERAILPPPGLRICSAVEIGNFQGQLRTQTIDARGHSTARTLNHALPRGRWNHLVITVDRRHEAQRVYVNGQDVTSTDHLGHRDWPAHGPIWLGRFSDRQKDRRLDLDGHLDDVRIYRGHLRQSAIQALSRTRQAYEHTRY
jgi:hypothetical protein